MKDAKKKGRNVWVVRSGTGFTIKEEGIRAPLVRTVTQTLAVTIARLIARANGSELVVQDVQGRIRSKDSHGADHFPPRG